MRPSTTPMGLRPRPEERDAHEGLEEVLEAQVAQPLAARGLR